MLSWTRVVLVFGCCLLPGMAVGQTVVYVDVDAPGPVHDGTSWADAYTDLQEALAAAAPGAKIRVAQGTYRPDGGTGDREATFGLITGVTIKGGYAGLGAPDPNARDIAQYETILSGDLAGNDVAVADPCDLRNEPTRAENCYHVVTGSGTDRTAGMDGLTITAGNAFQTEHYPGTERAEHRGGGMFNSDGGPTLVSCTFDATN